MSIKNQIHLFICKLRKQSAQYILYNTLRSILCKSLTHTLIIQHNLTNRFPNPLKYPFLTHRATHALRYNKSIHIIQLRLPLLAVDSPLNFLYPISLSVIAFGPLSFIWSPTTVRNSIRFPKALFENHFKGLFKNPPTPFKYLPSPHT